MVQTGHVVGVAVRQDDEIDVGKVNTLGLDVGCEDVPIVAGVEYDSFAGDLHESGEAPILFHRGIGTEGVIEDSDLAVGLSRGHSNRGDHGSDAGKGCRKKQCCAKLHGSPPVREIILGVCCRSLKANLRLGSRALEHA